MSTFVEIGPSVLEKIFEGSFFIYGHDGYLGHVTLIIYIYTLLPPPIDASHEIWL